MLVRDDACLDSEVARLTVSRVRLGTRIGFVGFDAGLGHEVPLMRIDCEESRRAVVARLRVSRPDDGWTGWADALRAVIDVAGEDQAGRRRAVLAVSGRPVGGGRVNWAREPEGEACRLLAARGWRLFTVGTGAAAEDRAARRMLRYLARTSGGRSSVAATAEETMGACRAVVDRLSGHRPLAGQAA